MKEIRLVIAGSRGFNDYESLKRWCDLIIDDNENVEIISGAARGADKLGEKYAEERDYKLVRFSPDWDKLGKSAGFLRNIKMAKYCTHAIVFWDGESRGARHMIDQVIQLDRHWHLIHYNNFP